MLELGKKVDESKAKEAAMKERMGLLEEAVSTAREQAEISRKELESK